MGALKIPFAIQYGNMVTRGQYIGENGPIGLMVHFTAGRWDKGLASGKATIDGGIKNGYTFLDIAYTGELLQAHDIMQYGWHAGESGWQLKFGKVIKKFKGLSDEIIGVEMNNPGKLDYKGGKFISWFGQEVDPKLVRHVQENEIYIASDGRKYTWDCPTGYYMKYSDDQELTLNKTILWHYGNILPFKLENVIGHHEGAGLHGIGRWRKNDPGGALSMPMAALRDHLITHKHYLTREFKIDTRY